MAFPLLMLCALCEAFLLRFLMALVREGREASRAKDGPRRSKRAIESRELFPMKSESIRSRHKEKQERTRAVFVLIGMLVLISALPLLAQEASSPAQAVPPDVMKQIEALTKRVEQLEQQLKEHEAVEQPTTVVYSAKATAPAQSVVTPAITQGELSTAEPAKKEKIAPFSDWDWTWLNGNPRNKDVAFDSKFFTPEIRADITYNYDFNKPVDNSIGGSSEIFRSNEIQLEQLGVGGDFHYDNVRARFMTQFGMYSTTTVRNDPSYAKGQWNINEAHRYLAEAYGGYHINALNGINVDAGIFMSYIGLFSYYNFDNWAYQPSYVSSNTPWFFEGLRDTDFSHAPLEDRAVDHQWMAIVRLGQFEEGLGWTDQVDSETLDEHHLQQLRPWPRRPLHTEARPHPHRRQYRDQVLRQTGKPPRQDGVFLHRRSGLRIWRRGELPRQYFGRSQAELCRLHAL